MAVSLTSTAEYSALQTHYEEIKQTNMRTLFQGDADRFDKFR